MKETLSDKRMTDALGEGIVYPEKDVKEKVQEFIEELKEKDCREDVAIWEKHIKGMDLDQLEVINICFQLFEEKIDKLAKEKFGDKLI